MTQSHYPQNPFFVSECLPLRYPFSISFIISSSGLFGKWPISPAVVEIVSNGALMVLSKAFLFRLVGPHHPAVQGFVELARPHQPLTDPVVETGAWDVQRANQFCRPPFVGQESVAGPDTGARRSHSQPSL